MIKSLLLFDLTRSGWHLPYRGCRDFTDPYISITLNKRKFILLLNSLLQINTSCTAKSVYCKIQVNARHFNEFPCFLPGQFLKYVVLCIISPDLTAASCFPHLLKRLILTGSADKFFSFLFIGNRYNLCSQLPHLRIKILISAKNILDIGY